jgi:hypothetical protein
MTGAPAPAPSRSDRWLLGGWILAIAVAVPGTVKDTDPYWQIRAGLESLQGAPVARPDSWSWAPVDGLFYPNSPAWNVVIAVAWKGLGFWGLYLVTVACVAAMLGLTAHLARRLGARPIQVVGVVILTSAAVLPILSPRPAVAAQALFLLAVAFAVWWADRCVQRSPLVNAVVASLAGLGLSWLGNWIHLSWSTLAVTAAVAWAAVWLLSPLPTRRTRVVLVVSGTVGLALGVALGPYGSDVLTRTSAVVAACRDLVYEWTSPFSGAMGLRWWPLAVSVVVSVALCARWCLSMWRRRPRDSRLPLAAALTLVTIPYAVAGLLFIRFIPLAILTLAPLAAAAWTAGSDALSRRVASAPEGAGYVRRRLPEWCSDAFWRVILWAVLVVVAPLALFAGSRHTVPATLAVNDMLPSGCRMFGGSYEAASIILTRPDVSVWFDGRADYWGRDRLVAAHRYLYEGDQPTLVPPGTTCVVLGDPASDRGLQRLTDALDGDTAWSRVPGTANANLWIPASAAGALS